MTPYQRFARSLVLKGLAQLREGRLIIQESSQVHAFGDGDGPQARISIEDPRVFPSIAFGGHVGAAEAYAERWWSTEDLTSVVRVLVRNREVLDGLEKGTARLVQPIRRLLHALQRNTRGGSRKNISAHYDLGNEFFRQFLDETMTYSSGYFEHAESSLADASRAKYDRICRRLRINADTHVLEIGTGWGGFAIHAASHFGARVTTTTISREQFELARRRVRAAGVDHLVEVLMSDYRDLEGEYDRLVSIEMIEAVGHQYYTTYFETCARLLKPDGLAAIQAITIQDRFYKSALREIDFIKKHIFPGSSIPSLSVLLQSAADTDLRLVNSEDFGPHYAQTLSAWRRRFEANRVQIERLGFDRWFRRMWRFYFCYCEGGFLEGAIGVSQLVLAKPQAALSLQGARLAEEGVA